MSDFNTDQYGFFTNRPGDPPTATRRRRRRKKQVHTQFDGATYDGVLDGRRLTGQLRRVWEVLRDCEWFTLAEIKAAAGGFDSEAGISARIRDFRKLKFGGFTVEARRRTTSLWEYSIRPPENK